MAKFGIVALLASAIFFNAVAAQSGNRPNPNSPITPGPPRPTGGPLSLPPYMNSSFSTPLTMGGGAMGDNPTYNTSALGPPDVWLRVPTIGVKKIELDVDNLQAELNLAANVANLVNLNVGVYVSIKKVNLTIADVGAEAELIIRLKPLVEIVNRVFKSLDLNPLLISAIDDVTSIVDNVVGAVDGLLGAITRGDTKLSFLIDNLGNIVQNVVGGKAGNTPQTSIVGNYAQNMTFTGQQKTLQDGNVQKTYKYDPLGSLVNIVFDKQGQIVQATVQKKDGQGGGGQQPGMGQSQGQGGMGMPQMPQMPQMPPINPGQMGGMQQPPQQAQPNQQAQQPQQPQQQQQPQQGQPPQQPKQGQQPQQQAAPPQQQAPQQQAQKPPQQGQQPQAQQAPKLERRAGSQVISPPPSPIV